MTVDGFNMEKVTEMIDGSDLGGMQKTLLSGLLTKAQENPEQLKAVLAQIREALNI